MPLRIKLCFFGAAMNLGMAGMHMYHNDHGAAGMGFAGCAAWLVAAFVLDRFVKDQ